MRYEITIDDHQEQVEVERTPTGWRVRFKDEEWIEEVGSLLSTGELRLQAHPKLGVVVTDDEVLLQIEGQALRAKVTDPRKYGVHREEQAAGVLSTPMPGVVVRIPVEVGQRVSVGEILIVVEAMKMENEFKATAPGIVKTILVSPGQALEADTELLHLELDGES